TNAPSTKCTPSALVRRANRPIITRMVVMLAISLSRVSFDQRGTLNTSRRPKLKLRTRNSAVPSTLWATPARSRVLRSASPKMTDRTIADGVIEDGSCDDDLPNCAAQKSELAHHQRHDLYRGNRQRRAEEERRDQALLRLGQHAGGQQRPEQAPAQKRHDDSAHGHGDGWPSCISEHRQ